MYDEFERAVTGKPKKGIPVFGWVLIVVAFLFMFGIFGAGFAAHRMAHRFERQFSEEFAADLAEELEDLEVELAEELSGLEVEIAAEVADALAEVEMELAREFGDGSALMAADLLSKIQPRLERLIGDPEAGLAFLQDIGSRDYSDKALREVLEGSLKIRTEDGELTADLWRGEDGGSLVIESPEGEVQIDLVKEDGGGELVIRTEEKLLRFGAGTAAEGLPRWVPRARWMPEDPTHLFSAVSDEGGLGAVSWETGRPPLAVLDFYRHELEDSGYRIREEHSAHDTGEMEGGFWAENKAEDRIVFIAASDESGVTKVILGYGEEH
jgi:hypothetical protein